MSGFDDIAKRHDEAMANKREVAEKIAANVELAKETLDGVVKPELSRCENDIRTTRKVAVSLWSRSKTDEYGYGLELQVNRLHNKVEPYLLKFIAADSGEIEITHDIGSQSRTRKIQPSDASTKLVREEALAFFESVLKEEENF